MHQHRLRPCPLLPLLSALVLLGVGAYPGLAQNIFTIAGLPNGHRADVDSQPATQAPLGNVYGLLIDRASGRLVFNDQFLVLRREPDSVGTLIALAGSDTFAALNAPSNLASAYPLGLTRGMAQDAAGRLYVALAGAGLVIRLNPDGTVSSFAGGGATPNGGPTGDGGPATAAYLGSPRGLAFDSHGNLDIAEAYCDCIRQVSPDGVISTLFTLPRTPRTSIEGLAIDAQDNLYLTEYVGHVVIKLNASDGSTTVIAGNGTAGFSGDGGPATAAQLQGPSGVTLDAHGNLYIADTLNHRIRFVSASDGMIRTIAGSGDPSPVGSRFITCAFSGDGGPATAAQLCQPAETVFDSAGNLYISDFGNSRVRKVAPDGTISTVAGSGQTDPAFTQISTGDGGHALKAKLLRTSGIAFDPAGNLYVSESDGYRVRRVTPDGIISTYAGTGGRGFTGEGGPAVAAQIYGPGPLTWGPDGALYITTSDDRILKVTPDGILHLVAGSGPGTGINRAQGDGGPAVQAVLNEPGGVAVDRNGNVFIADTSNARVRKVDPNGVITTVLGPGQPGTDYDNAVAIDSQGALYVAITHAPPGGISSTVSRVNADGSLTKVAGSGEACTNGINGQEFPVGPIPATQAKLCAVVGLATDANGTLYLTEGEYGVVLRLNADGTLQRIAGDSLTLDNGDGGPALAATLFGGQGWSPSQIAFSPGGTMYLAEPGLNVVREVTPESLQLQFSPNPLNFAASATAGTPVTQTLTIGANFPEPFPYGVQIQTNDGGHWLSANRQSGELGDLLTFTADPTGLAPGVYRASISITVTARMTLQSGLSVAFAVQP